MCERAGVVKAVHCKYVSQYHVRGNGGLIFCSDITPQKEANVDTCVLEFAKFRGSVGIPRATEFLQAEKVDTQ